MGVDVDAEVFIGVYFESGEDANTFLVEHFGADVGCDLHEEVDKIGRGISVQSFTYYDSDSPCVIGEQLCESEIEHTGKNVADIYLRVKEKMPLAYKDKVSCHIFAQYS